MKKNYPYNVGLVTTLFVVYSFCLNTASAVFSNAIKTSLLASNVGLSVASSTFILGFAFIMSIIMLYFIKDSVLS